MLMLMFVDVERGAPFPLEALRLTQAQIASPAASLPCLEPVTGPRVRVGGKEIHQKIARIIDKRKSVVR